MAQIEIPAEIIPVASIQDKWLVAMAEECDAQSISYTPKQLTTPSWGRQEFLEIPKLKATVGPDFTKEGDLALCPDEDPWDMRIASAPGYSPRGLAQMIIRRRLRQLSGQVQNPASTMETAATE